MPKRVLQGVVVSDKNDKTVVVKVERRLTHPVLKKTVRLTKKYHAHDEGNVFREGDVVRIQGMSADLEEQTVGGLESRIGTGISGLEYVRTLGQARVPFER